MKVILHVPGNSANTNGLLYLINEGKVILESVFHNSFLHDDVRPGDLQELSKDIFDSLPEQIKHDLQDGITYVIPMIQEVAESVMATKDVILNPDIKNIVIAVKETVEAGISVLTTVKELRQLHAANKTVIKAIEQTTEAVINKAIEEKGGKATPGTFAVAKKNTPERPIKRTAPASEVIVDDDNLDRTGAVRKSNKKAEVKKPGKKTEPAKKKAAKK